MQTFLHVIFQDKNKVPVHHGHTIFRSEEWHQTDGEGILEVRGSKLEIALFVNGSPLVYEYMDCMGSVARFIALLGLAQPIEAARAIAQSAANGFAEAAPLHEQIAPLLRLLPDGGYDLRLVEFVEDYLYFVSSDYLPPDQSPLELQKVTTRGYYPHSPDWVLLGTQPESILDAETIDKYQSQIESGQRPALITIGWREHWSLFVLDGHHKLCAYRRCGVAPHALNIEFHNLTPISAELAKSVLNNDPELAKDYLEYFDYRDF